MSAQALRDFADRVAAARDGSEKELFEQAVVVLAGDVRGKDQTRMNRLIRVEAFNELAIVLYRTALAGRGFQFGSPADCVAKRSRGVATTWRTGDTSAAVQQGATPALALLRATAWDSAGNIDAQRMAQCTICCGAGWIITAANTKQTCRHVIPSW